MRLLLDECVPRKLKFLFVKAGHRCTTAQEADLSSKTNGELLDLAELSFDVLITIDKNIQYQQTIANRRIAVLILRARSNDLSDIVPVVPYALKALATIEPGQFVEVIASS